MLFFSVNMDLIDSFNPKTKINIDMINSTSDINRNVILKNPITSKNKHADKIMAYRTLKKLFLYFDIR